MGVREAQDAGDIADDVDAAETIEAIRKVSPDYTVSWADKIFYLRDPAMRERFAKGLRAAGLPEG